MATDSVKQKGGNNESGERGSRFDVRPLAVLTVLGAAAFAILNRADNVLNHQAASNGNNVSNADADKLKHFTKKFEQLPPEHYQGLVRQKYEKLKTTSTDHTRDAVLANMLLLAGDAKDALAIAQARLQKNGKDFNDLRDGRTACSVEADALLALKKYAEAEKCYQQQVDRIRSDPPKNTNTTKEISLVQYNILLCREKQGNNDSARKLLPTIPTDFSTIHAESQQANENALSDLGHTARKGEATTEVEIRYYGTVLVLKKNDTIKEIIDSWR